MHLGSRSKAVVIAMWLVASIFYGYQYILRVLPNIMLTDIMEKFDIGAGTFGQFSGLYYIGYSLMHLPIGILIDRFGPKKVMTLSTLLTVVGVLPLIYTQFWVYPIVGRVLIGIGSSAAILGVFKVIRLSFQEKLFPRMLSISVTIGLVGAIYGGGPVEYLHQTLGYDTTLQLIALGGIALAAATYFIVPEMDTEEKKGSVFSDIKEVLSNRKVVLACLFAGMMVGPLEGFADVWGTAFLSRVYGYDGSVAATLPSMIFMGMCFGAPILSFIAEKVGSYLGTVVGTALIMATCFLILLMVPISSMGLTIAFIIVGVCCAYQIIAIYKISTFVREGVAGLTTAVANMIIMTFGYTFHTIIGNLVSWFGGAADKRALMIGVAVIPVALLLGGVGFLFLLAKERVSDKKAQITS